MPNRRFFLRTGALTGAGLFLPWKKLPPRVYAPVGRRRPRRAVEHGGCREDQSKKTRRLAPPAPVLRLLPDV